AFKMIKFSKEDLPFLHKALIDLYDDNSEQLNNIQYKIKQHLIDLNDSSTVDFIKEHYSRLAPNKETLKYRLLGILAEHKTSHSYSVLKNLLKSGLPKRGDTYGFSYALLDS